MTKVEQGELLQISGFKYPAIVVSNNFFNESGKVIVCPVVKDALAGPLHIRIDGTHVSGFVMCEQLRYVDLQARHFSRQDSIKGYDILNISDAVMGMFDYQML